MTGTGMGSSSRRSGRVWQTSSSVVSTSENEAQRSHCTVRYTHLRETAPAVLPQLQVLQAGDSHNYLRRNRWKRLFLPPGGGSSRAVLRECICGRLHKVTMGS